MITGDDIIYVYSGGTTNSDPDSSLGGDPSSHQISNGINNLFEDVEPEVVENGLTDYRCFYIFNNHITDSYYNSHLYMETEVENGGEVFLGVLLLDEVQSITVVGNITGGSLTLVYDGVNVVWGYTTDVATNATALGSALNSLTSLSGVTVNASQQSDDELPVAVYEITFGGDDGKRFHPLITIFANNLIGPSAVGTAKVVNGSPINSIANEIDVATTTPAGITFSKPTKPSPFVIGVLKATEGFPVWVMREILPGSVSAAADGFKIRFRGTPF